MRVFKGLLIVVCCPLLVFGCSKSKNPQSRLATLSTPGKLAAIQSRGELVVVTRNAPTVTYIDRDGRSSGPEHDLAAAFAKHLDVTPRFIEVDSVQAMLQAVAKGQADMAAGSITVTPGRKKEFSFGPSYAEVSQDVVCNRNNKPRTVADLAKVNKLVVAADTSYVSRLAALKKQHPDDGLHWKQATDIGTEQLLAEVAEGKIGCTIADSNIVAVNRRYHPQLLVMFKISQPEPLAWPMPKGAAKLRRAADKWLASYKKAGKLAALKEHYYGFIQKWDFVDKSTLVKRIDKVYPRFDTYFTKAAKKYDFDKWLLAAQAYQESHWNPEATSATGVRGIMMLTTNTAKALGVSDRLNPKQSIMGGAKYLRQMEKKLPDSLVAPDRYYFALAAYNIGYAHLRDAMHLTKRLGRSAKSWAAVSKTLPLLMQKKYYTTLKYGYARGTEPVRYVRRIRDYADVIRRVAGKN